MKNFIKQPTFLALIAFSLIFTACESNEDTSLIEEQDQIEAIDPSKILDLNTLVNTGTDARVRVTFAMRGNNGKYISSENGNARMTCNRPSAGSWEKFEFEPYPTISNAFYLKGNNGKYVRRESGYPYLRSFVTSKSNAELFWFIESGTKGVYYMYSLSATRYLQIPSDDRRPITCNGRYHSSLGRFTLSFYIDF